MKKTIIFMAVIAMIASCKKKEADANLSKPEEALSADIALTVKGDSQEAEPLYPESEKFNFLGYGYDVTDRFNDERSVRASVIDVALYDASADSRVNIMGSTETSWTTLQAENAEALAEKFSNSFQATKESKLFGNTIIKSFPETIFNDKKFVYGYYSYYMIRKRYAVFYQEALKSYLTAQFKRDISSLNAQELIHKYGTHILTGVKIGAKFDVIYQAAVPDDALNREEISIEGFRYAMSKTFGLITGYLDDPNLKNLNANSSAQIYYSTFGGNFRELKTEIVNNRLILNINNWKASTTEDKAKFIGPLDKGLEPLYDFIDDAGKRELVKTYIKQYCADKAVKLKK